MAIGLNKRPRGIGGSAFAGDDLRGEPSIVRLDDLRPYQRRLVLALMAAARTSALKMESVPDVDRTTDVVEGEVPSPGRRSVDAGAAR